MGRAVIDVATRDDGVAVERTLDSRIDDAGPAPDAVVIDFSLPAALPGLLDMLRGSGAALVSGTTGLSMQQHEALREYAKEAAVFYGENMSFGIAVLTELLPAATAYLAQSSDVEIVETHHRHKKDAPSGTALALARAIDGGQGREVPIHSVRVGGVPGDHQVIFAADEEIITLSHRALSRSVFARGSIRAARFVLGRAAGLYRMHDLVEAEREALIAKG